MTPLEIALIVLVSIWSIIFIIVAIAAIIVIREIKKAMDQVNDMLKTLDETVHDVAAPLQAVSGTMVGLAAKFGLDQVQKFLSSKSKK